MKIVAVVACVYAPSCKQKPLQSQRLVYNYPGGRALTIMDSTGKPRPKGVPFSSWRYILG